MRKIAMIAALALSLAACNTANVPPPAGNSATPTPEASASPAPAATACAVTATAMYGAEALYNVPAHAYVTADATPALASRFAPVKARAKGFLTAAYEGLKKARLLYKAGDGAFCGAVDELKSNADEANRLIPK